MVVAEEHEELSLSFLEKIFSITKQKHHKVLTILGVKIKFKQNKYKTKLGASYNLFDGEELLEASVRSIRSQVDYINVVYQNISNYGNKTETDLRAFLGKLMNKGLIDEIFLYVPNLTEEGMWNEKNKRNIGLELSKKAGCTHFLSLDTDEFYNENELAEAKEAI